MDSGITAVSHGDITPVSHGSGAENKKSGILTVLVLCLVYSLIQLPTHTPALTNGLFYNTSNVNTLQYHTVLGNFFVTETIVFCIATIVFGVITPSLQRCMKPWYLLVLACLLSVGRFFSPDSLPLKLHTIPVTCDGAGYAILYLTITSLVRERTQYAKIPRNFSLFAAVYGTSYIIFASVIIVTQVPLYHNILKYFTLCVFTLGCVIVVAFLCYSLCCPDTTEWCLHASFKLDRLQFHHEIGRTLKFLTLFVVLFYVFVTSLLSDLYCRCSYLTESYHAESLITYGVGYMLACIHWSYHYTKWYSTTRTIFSAFIILVCIIMTHHALHDMCTFTEHFHIEHWYFMPILGLVLGLGMGSVTSEVYTIINITWSSEYRFAAVLIGQSLWAILFLYFTKSLVYVVLAFVFSVLYVLSVVWIQVKMRKFSGRLARYKHKIRNVSIYGSVGQYKQRNGYVFRPRRFNKSRRVRA